MSSFEPKSPALEIGQIFTLEVTKLYEANAISAAVSAVKGTIAVGDGQQLAALNNDDMSRGPGPQTTR